MAIASVKKSYFLNLINTVSGLLFPLITFPYASRVLLPQGIGEVQFLDSIIGYILLLTSLGIPLYAVREVARVRDDKLERSKIATEIIILHTCLTAIAYIIIAIIAFSVNRISANIPLFLLLSTTLIFTTIGVQWFYQAMEDFKYITIRSILIKIAAALSLFLFVKDSSDVIWYAAVNTMASVGNNIFNIIRLRKHITFKGLNFNDLNIKRHIKPSLKLFTLNLIVSIYIQLDVVMLGFFKGDQIVGYYTAATKLTRMSLGIITSLGAVLLPRFSNYISMKRDAEFKELANKAISFTLALVVPMTIGLIMLAEPIILLFSGENYIPAIKTLQLISPITIFIGFSGIIGMQMLYPLGKENIVIKSTLAGAILNATLNIILIPQFSQNGAAFASSVAEFTVLISMIIMGHKYLPLKPFVKENLNYIIGSIIMVILIKLLLLINLSPLLLLIIIIPLSILTYFIYLLATKDHFVMVVINYVKQLYSKNEQICN